MGCFGSSISQSVSTLHSLASSRRPKRVCVRTELVQTKRDLKRTKLAEQTARERKAQKNTPLQVGGVLTVEQGREMVVTTETLHDARINPRNNKP